MHACSSYSCSWFDLWLSCKSAPDRRQTHAHTWLGTSRVRATGSDRRGIQHAAQSSCPLEACQSWHTGWWWAAWAPETEVQETGTLLLQLGHSYSYKGAECGIMWQRAAVQSTWGHSAPCVHRHKRERVVVLKNTCFLLLHVLGRVTGAGRLCCARRWAPVLCDADAGRLRCVPDAGRLLNARRWAPVLCVRRWAPDV